MSSASIRSTAQRVRLADVVRQRPGNSKLIKGRLQSDPAPGLFPAFSASGQDIFCPAAEFEGDAVVVSAVGARCGKCFLASGKWTAIANTHVLLPDHSRINTKYLWYLVNDERFWIRGGSAQPFVRVKDTLQKDLLLPELHKQRRIVAEIEKQFSRLDQAVASLQRVKAQLKRYKASVLKAAVEGRLVETEAERARREGRGFETGTELAAQGSANAARGRKPGAALPYETGKQLLERILETRRSQWKGKGKYKEPAAPETVGLPELPEGWVWVALPQLGEIGRGKSKHRPRDDAKLYGGTYPFIQTGDVRKSDGSIRDYNQTYSDFGLQQSRLWPNGTLCITIAANIAETGILALPACFPDSVVGFVSDEPMLTRFVEVFIRTIREKLEQFAPATAQKNINLATLENIMAPLPPLAEQHRIVAEVDRRLSIVREVEAEVDANLKRAQALRQSVLARAFAA